MPAQRCLEVNGPIRRRKKCFQRSGFLVNPTCYAKMHHKLFSVHFEECQVKYWTVFHDPRSCLIKGFSLTHCIMLRSKKRESGFLGRIWRIKFNLHVIHMIYELWDIAADNPILTEQPALPRVFFCRFDIPGAAYQVTRWKALAWFQSIFLIKLLQKQILRFSIQGGSSSTFCMNQPAIKVRFTLNHRLWSGIQVPTQYFRTMRSIRDQVDVFGHGTCL